MLQFINGSPDAFLALKNQALGKCIRFHEEMPTGASPTMAHVGFEIDSTTDKAILWVNNDVEYSGENSEIEQWFSDGKKEFNSFEELKGWLQATLSMAYQREDTDNAEDMVRGADAGHKILPAEPSLYLEQDQVRLELAHHIKGQDLSLNSLASIISCHCAKEKPSRPAVIFAVGPSGVGKTRTAEVLPEVLAKLSPGRKGYQYLRLDMTEYQESYRISQLLGSPQGYVGHGDGSQLIDALRANPKTIVLFDEIEKAHPKILKVLMNAMDAGRLTSSSGVNGSHEIDCCHAIFMFTSNLDAQPLLDELNSRDAFEDRMTLDEICRRRLKDAGLAPEIVARIGRFLVYQPLIGKIQDEILVVSLHEIATEYGVALSFIEPKVITYLQGKLHTSDFGARPGRYLIDDELGLIMADAAKNGKKIIKIKGLPLGYEVD